MGAPDEFPWRTALIGGLIVVVLLGVLIALAVTGWAPR